MVDFLPLPRPGALLLLRDVAPALVAHPHLVLVAQLGQDGRVDGAAVANSLAAPSGDTWR